LIAHEAAALGLVKVQLVADKGETVLIPSVVVGDPTRDGQRLGSTAVGLAIWFGIQQLGVTRVSLRFYDDNAASLALARAYQYEHVRSDVEQAGGKTRNVLVYEITADKWLRRNAGQTGEFELLRA
jgi:RimJ/RimL family protein N-acetyltransferase